MAIPYRRCGNKKRSTKAGFYNTTRSQRFKVDANQLTTIGSEKVSVHCLVQVCLDSRVASKCDLGCVHQGVVTLGSFIIPQADRNGTLRYWGRGEGEVCTVRFRCA